MGHACQILTFETDNKKLIQNRCDEWGDHNCDLEERGWHMGGGLGSSINFTNRIFDCLEDAEKYLEGTFGDYRQTAVQYRKSDNKSKALAALKEKRQTEYKKYCELSQKPHYKGVKSKYIKCKTCGSSLATEYCGKTWYNTCPICRDNLLPKNILEKIEKAENNLKVMDEKIKEEERKINKNGKLCWAVACEVHC